MMPLPMPNYEYQCPACGHVKEKIRRVEQRDSPLSCDKCNASVCRNPFPYAPRPAHRKYPPQERVGEHNLASEPSDPGFSQATPRSQAASRSSAISLVRVGDAQIRNCHFENLDRAIEADHETNLTVSNTSFENVNIPIERHRKANE